MPHKNNFDGLRLIAAMLVLISHQFVLTGRPEPRAIDPYTFGTLGVLIFFSISGYLVAASWVRDPRLIPFAKKRLLRIWPGLAATVMILSVIAIVMQPARWKFAAEFMSNILFWHHWGVYFQANPYPMLNGPLWTIPVEVFCYLAFAVLALLAGFQLRGVLLAVLFAIGVVLTVNTDAEIQNLAQRMGDPTFTPWLCGVFMMASLLQVWVKFRALGWWLIAAGVVLIVFGKVALGLLLAAPPLMIAIGEASWPILRSGARFGDLSYGVYLWAWPVQQAVIYLVGKERPVILLAAMSTALTLLLAFSSWHLIEKRALRWKPSVSAKPGS